MTECAKRLKDELLLLSDEDRAELVEVLCESLHPADEAQWEAELDRRIQEMEIGAVQGRPAPEMFAELRKRYA
jgi:putative addiction module component (TIGR02574 family)